MDSRDDTECTPCRWLSRMSANGAIRFLSAVRSCLTLHPKGECVGGLGMRGANRLALESAMHRLTWAQLCCMLSLSSPGVASTKRRSGGAT